MTEVILVNEKDEAIGQMEKIQAHEKGKLHRAFSIFLVNDKMQVLLQKRKLDKYHSGGLWSNACCSHPLPEEKTIDAAHRRMIEELNMDCKLDFVFSFIYKIKLENVIENEYDHVYIGKTNETPNFNPDEISEIKWVELDFLLLDLKLNPKKYSYWFHHILTHHFKKIERYFK